MANPKKKTTAGKKTTPTAKKAVNTSVQPQTIYPDYAVWLKNRSWSLEEAAWLLVGLDPAMAVMCVNCKLLNTKNFLNGTLVIFEGVKVARSVQIKTSLKTL